MAGYSDVLIGMQWGDEGKGRFIDYLLESGQYQIVTRFQGGPNAGHTLNVNGHTLALHGLPSGIFHPSVQLYIGAGCVINPTKLLAEIAEVENLGVSLEGRLLISPYASLIQPHHILEDKFFGAHLGTTGNGIGPAYSQRMIRCKGEFLNDVRFAEAVLDPRSTSRIVRSNLDETITNFGQKQVERMAPEFLPLNLWEKFRADIHLLEQYLETDPLYLTKQVEQGKNVLFEGAQASELDVTYGNSPFTTSSNTISSAAYTGGDLNHKFHRKTIGVLKAIPSRVGAGPFVAELGGKKSEYYCMEEGGKKNTKEYEQDHHHPQTLLTSKDDFNVGIALRMLGNEYGATTKRPRRIGMLDTYQLEFAAKLNGINEIYITKIDELHRFNQSHFNGVPVVESYQLNQQEIHSYPITTLEMASAKPHSINIFGGIPDVITSTKWNELPRSILELVERLESACSAKVLGLGVGPEREKVIFRK